MSLAFPTEYRGILCHPDGQKSCGACCGVYNFQDASHESTTRRLRENTLAFRQRVQRDQDQAAEFAESHRVPTNAKLLSGLQNCHFLGFLDDQDREPRGRIGCLVHPLANNGWDARELGVYDEQTCESYLCAAHNLLRDVEKWLVIHSVPDSYLYGLIITDVRFVRELFERAADANGEMPPWERLARPDAQTAAAAYFELKRNWLYAGKDAVFGQLTSGEDLDTPRREPPWVALGVEPHPVDVALTCLATHVNDISQLEDARRRVTHCIDTFAAAVRVAP